ncbi:MAG: NF038129 family PEP-CTERM protein [Methylomonas sp.]|jgi:hypothetical protein
MQYRSLIIKCFQIVAFNFFGGVYAYATEIDANINTASLSGTTAEIAFDFIAGDGDLLNSAVISNFVTDGSFSPGTATLSGAAAGDLTTTATLLNTAFFNEILQPITLGSDIGFSVNLTQNLDPAATVPDSLSVFLLDGNGNNLFTTTDPTGADALLEFNIDGGALGNLNVYTATADINQPVTWSAAADVTSAVPEPAGIWLFAAGLFGLYCKRTAQR